MIIVDFSKWISEYVEISISRSANDTLRPDNYNYRANEFPTNSISAHDVRKRNSENT